MGLVYLYVVPQLESSLTASKLSRLEDRGSQQSAHLLRAMREGLSQPQLGALIRRVSQATDSRVTLLGVRDADGVPRPAFVISDSQARSSPVAARFDVATQAPEGQARAGTAMI